MALVSTIRLLIKEYGIVQTGLLGVHLIIRQAIKHKHKDTLYERTEFENKLELYTEISTPYCYNPKVRDNMSPCSKSSKFGFQKISIPTLWSVMQNSKGKGVSGQLLYELCYEGTLHSIWRAGKV